ncbi:MAG: hypothetical protein JWQ09_1792 [Segetibacter sp.]|nr:hypothetical protein [Segetibacter sp.]
MDRGTSKKGTRKDETRYTIIIKDELLEKVKGLAYWNNVPIKDIIEEMISDQLLLYEYEHGEIKQVPVKNKIVKPIMTEKKAVEKIKKLKEIKSNEGRGISKKNEKMLWSLRTAEEKDRIIKGGNIDLKKIK